MVYNINMHSLTYLVFIPFFTIACSSVSQDVQFQKNWNLREKKISEKEATEYIKRKLSFLRDTFEQLHDSNYQSPKWDEFCRSANLIGEMKEESDVLLSISTLWTDKNYRTGLCPGFQDAKKSKIVFLYCRSKKVLLEIKCPADECQNYTWKRKC